MRIAQLCLIEPIMPLGPEHPYARTMLNYHGKFQTPSGAASKHTTASSQGACFKSLGWGHVDASDLWEAWSGSHYVNGEERRALDEVEAFDEWEEFILFGRHHAVIHALATKARGNHNAAQDVAAPEASEISLESIKLDQAKSIKRRFGNFILASNAQGHRYAAHVFGSGVGGCADTYDLYGLKKEQLPHKLPHHGPPPRMCSTLTDLGDFGTLLVGGRDSHEKALAECWLLSKGRDASWQKTWDFPTPIYRHSAIPLRGSSLALIVGGKTSFEHVSTDSFLFHPEKGWLHCKIIGEQPESVFGAVLCNSSGGESGAVYFSGLRCGGLRQDGVMSSKTYFWQLSMVANEVCRNPSPLFTLLANHARLADNTFRGSQKHTN